MREALRSSLVARARRATETENSQHVTDAELQEQAAYGADEFYDLYTSAYGDLPFRLVDTFTTIDGVEVYDLPDNFYQARLVMANVSGRWHRLMPYADTDEPALINAASTNYGMMYQIVGAAPNGTTRSFSDQISLLPVPIAGTQVRVKYLPTTQARDAGGGDVAWPSVNGFDEFVLCHLNWYILQKREQDSTALLWSDRKSAIARRVREKADARDTGAASTVADVRFGRGAREADRWPWDSYE